MVLSEVNKTTMGRITNSMPKKNSKDEFSLSNPPAKKLSYSPTPVLTTLFIDCIEKRIIPECLKHATVAPIHKSADTEHHINFRPISQVVFQTYFRPISLCLFWKKSIPSHNH